VELVLRRLVLRQEHAPLPRTPRAASLGIDLLEHL
jgi:hypothetical protein